MADDFTRTWVDFADDLDAENMNDLESRMEARVGAGTVGMELGYASNTVGTIFGGTALTDITSLSTTVVCGSRPIMVKFQCDAAKSTSIIGAGFYISQDGTTQGEISGVTTNLSGTVYLPCSGQRRFAPTAGTHIYKISARNLTAAGTLTAIAGPGTALQNSPMWIQVVQI